MKVLSILTPKGQAARSNDGQRCFLLASKWRPMEDTMLSEINWAQKDKSYMSVLTCTILKKEKTKQKNPSRIQIRENSTAVTTGWVRGRKQKADGKTKWTRIDRYLIYHGRAKANNTIWVWWHTPITPALGRLRQEDWCKYEAGLGYTLGSRPAWTCLRKTQIKTII